MQLIGNAFLRATHRQAKNTRGTKKNLQKKKFLQGKHSHEPEARKRI